MSDPREVPVEQFYGGQSSDEAIGTAASFSYSRALEHRRNPSQLTVLPGPRKIGVPNDLILNIIQTRSGARYGFGDQGNIYKIDNSNVFTYVGKLPAGSDGALYRSDTDACYFATQTDLRRMWPMSGTPALDIIYGPSKSIDAAASRTGGVAAGNSYTIPLVIDENQYISFQPDIEPFYSQKVNVLVKGTGNVTMTLHDGLNNTLATVTVTAANMAIGLQEWLYSSQIRALVKPNARTYHLHFTSTVADTTIACATAGVLNTADFELWAYRLVDTTNNLHPIAQFQQFTLIGNGNYLAVWEPLTENSPPNIEFNRHRLTFPAGFECCGIAVTDEFAVIAIEKYSSDGTKDFQEGKLIVWDGFGQTYNQVIDVSGGSPQSIQAHENYPYFVAGGALCAWPGGKEIVKIRTFNNTDPAYRDSVDATRVFPNMMAIRDNMLHVGYPSTTNNVALEYGVYIWGTLEKNYPASFNYAYVASAHQTTNTGVNKQIGCIRNFGDEMYISWKDDNGAFGLDIVDSFCDPAPVFKFRARRFSGGAVYRDKQALKLALITAALPANVSITSTWSIDGGAYVSGDKAMGQNDFKQVTKIPSTAGQFKRIVYGFDGTCSGSVTPKIFSEVLQYNPQPDRSNL